MITIDPNLFPHDSQVYVAYSGGLDSHVLLHLLKNSIASHRLSAIHVHHQLNQNANDWLKHCRDICQNYQIPLMEIMIDARAPKGLSQEAYARELRYAQLKKQLKKNDFLVTAHHQDDQAETVLLQLFRGAGAAGLAAMPQMITFGEGFLLRPLLNVTREQLLSYAKKYQLKWIEDDSNMNKNFDRNFLRHEIIPLLKQKWPSLTNTLARSARHQAELDRVLNDYVGCEIKFGNEPDTLSIKDLQSESDHKKILWLRYWLKSLRLKMPNEKHFREIIKLIHAKKGSNPSVKYGNIEIRRYKNNLYAFSCNHLKRKHYENFL